MKKDRANKIMSAVKVLSAELDEKPANIAGDLCFSKKTRDTRMELFGKAMISCDKELAEEIIAADNV